MRAAYENVFGMFEKIHENETQLNDFVVFVKQISFKKCCIESFREDHLWLR